MVKIEPPGGEPCRRVGPFLDDIPHPERSLSFWYYNTSKRGITLDLETADGRRLFRRLAATSDVVLETFRPGFLASLGLDYESLRDQNPGLIMCALTPFGQTGPWRDYASSDLLHMAAGGEMASSGYDEADVPDAPPIAQALIAANPDRMLWGSNWPHPGRGKTREDLAPPYPSDDGAQINQLPNWASDPTIRKKILVDNPARLYGFPTA